MDEQTLEALKGSIEKWEKIVSGDGGDAGADNCPLCNLFNNVETPVMCFGCPVMEQTGEDGCGDTPYQNWCDTFKLGHPLPRMAETDEQKTAAKAELEFLRSLLPLTPQHRQAE